MNILDKERQLFFQTYKRIPLDIVKGEGCYLYDREGKQYLDLFGGLAVNALGYNNPRVNAAIAEQVSRYIHLSNFYVQEPQVRLAEKLLGVTGYKRLFFTNSGTEAIEGAMKLARKWGKKQGKTHLFGLSNAFHGRTMGALSLTERPKYRDGYEPFLPNVGHMTFNDVNDLKSTVDAQTAGVVLECIQGEGGIYTLTSDFVAALNELRERYGFLIIADEIQSGLGRTGKFFSFEHLGLQPDVVVVAKPIGGGLPLGAFLGNERVEDVFTYGVHGTTFGGNPVACAAGLATLEEIVDGGAMQRAEDLGSHLKSRLVVLQQELPTIIAEVRGFGCMLGIELKGEGQPVVDELQRRGILINCTNTNVLRLLPPFIVSREECVRFLVELGSVLRAVFSA